MNRATKPDNDYFAKHFEEIADWLEIEGSNAFRIRAYRNAAQAIRDLPSMLAEMITAGEDLSKIKGIGDAVAEKSAELLETGKIKALEELRQKYPAGLLKLLDVPSLGAKKVGVLHAELGIHDIATLKTAAEAGKLQKLKGFGAKTEQAILHGISIAEAAAARMRIDKATRTVAKLREYFAECKAITKLDFAGSFRRSRESVGDIDILAVCDNPATAMDHFAAYQGLSEVLQRGDTKMSVRLESSFQADLRIVPANSWGAALQYFTGSQQHNIRVRQIAKDKGYKLNEYGLFPLDTNSGSGEAAESAPCEKESQVYEALGLPYMDPEFRENRFEFEPDFAERAQSIVSLSDIHCDLHMHTVATDGTETIESMAAAAASRGYSHIAITDHSQRVAMANGLTPARALEQWAVIDELNRSGKCELWIFKGIECDILEDGQLDLPDEILQQADWVLASVHYGQKQSREQITDRMLNAVRNPYVSAIAHPTGRLIGHRDPYEVDLVAVIEAAVEYGKVLELNSNPRRLDLSDIHCMTAIAKGVLLTINTDAHSIDNLDLMYYGIKQARRAGVSYERVINTWTLERFREFVAQSRQR